MYNKIKVFGGLNLNSIWCKNKIDNSTTIENIVEQGVTPPTWDSDTILLANYKINIDASNIGNIADSIIGYKIKRLQSGVLYQVCDTGSNEKKIQDYIVRNNADYQYRISPILEDENGVRTIGNPILTNTVNTDWTTYSIIGTKQVEGKLNTYMVDEDNIWKFNLNMNVEPHTHQSNKSFYDTFGEFTKASKGNRNYTEGGFSCLIGSVNATCQYEDNIELVDKLNDFVNNGELKIYKDRKGRVYPIELLDASDQDMTNAIGQPTSITVKWRQLDKADNISVYGITL